MSSESGRCRTTMDLRNKTKQKQKKCFRFLHLQKHKHHSLVYDILPSTTAVFTSYAIGSGKLSANEQFLVGAQTVVSLLQTTQIKQGVSFIAASKVYTSEIKPQSFESRRWMRALALGCFYSHINTRTFRRALTASLDSGVTKSGRVWRKVPESDAWSVAAGVH